MNLSAMFKKFVDMPFDEKRVRMLEFYDFLKTHIYYKRIFSYIGRNSKILKPLKLDNAGNIYIGENVLVNKYCWLMTMQIDKSVRPQLNIGNGTKIGHFCHITCVNKVTIGKYVLVADKVHISDNSHRFLNPHMPIMDQGIDSTGEVEIGDGSWIGENVSILSCRIGKNCVIGANAVVIKDIPGYSVAVGVPAKTIKTYNFNEKKWIRVL
jgi:acetyltransferase-like isoleucine patch superfamily enzyme